MAEQKFMHLSISPLSENIYEFLVLVLEISGLPQVYSNHKIQKIISNQAIFVAESPLSKIMTIIVPIIRKISITENIAETIAIICYFCKS